MLLKSIHVNADAYITMKSDAKENIVNKEPKVE